MLAGILSLVTGGLIKQIIGIVYEIILRFIGLIFYLASSYWGRWVLVACVICIGLCYGRYHYIHVGQQREADFRELIIDSQLKERCELKGGSLAPPREKDSWLPEGWPK